MILVDDGERDLAAFVGTPVNKFKRISAGNGLVSVEGLAILFELVSIGEEVFDE